MQRLILCLGLAIALVQLTRDRNEVVADVTEGKAVASGLLATGALTEPTPAPIPTPQPDPDDDGRGQDAEAPAAPVQPAAQPKVKKVAAPRVECDGDSCRVVEGGCSRCQSSCDCSQGECGDGSCHSAGAGHHHGAFGPIRRRLQQMRDEAEERREARRARRRARWGRCFRCG